MLSKTKLLGLAYEALCNLVSATFSNFICPFSSLLTHLVATLISFFQQIQKALFCLRAFTPAVPSAWCAFSPSYSILCLADSYSSFVTEIPLPQRHLPWLPNLKQVTLIYSFKASWNFLSLSFLFHAWVPQWIASTMRAGTRSFLLATTCTVPCTVPILTYMLSEYMLIEWMVTSFLLWSKIKGRISYNSI